jgi:adenylate cyclase
MTEQSEQEKMAEGVWRRFLLTGQETKEFRHRRLFARLPSNPRCRFCDAPFRGAGGFAMRLIYDKRPSRLNPHLCNLCENFAEKYQGGAEVESSLLFADVRGSTTIAEGMSPSEFGRLIDRFYKAVSAVLIHSDALIDKLIGDQAAGIYVPGFAGPHHARRAIEAAQEVLQVTGHHGASGPWIPLGIGVHTGIAFVGSVGSKDATTDITVLGDAPNTAARLSGSAKAGEILITEAASASAGLNVDQLDGRLVELKGKAEPVPVFALAEPTSLTFKD